MKNLRVTENDNYIFTYLNVCGYATLKQVFNYMLANQVGYKSFESLRNRVYSLVSAGYLFKFVYRSDLVLFNTNLTAKRSVNPNVNFAKLEHSLMVNEVYNYLKLKYTNFSIMNEHQIRAGMLVEQNKVIGINGKIPDLIINDFETSKSYWVEVELNLKSSQRFEKILNEYKSMIITGKIDGVYYFTDNNEVVSFFKKYLKDNSGFNIRIFLYSSNSWIDINSIYNLG